MQGKVFVTFARNARASGIGLWYGSYCCCSDELLLFIFFHLIACIRSPSFLLIHPLSHFHQIPLISGILSF